MTDLMDNSADANANDDAAEYNQRPMTRADDLRPAVAAQILDFMSSSDNGLPLRTVQQTAGRSILLDFDDGSRLIIQIAAIPTSEEVDVELSQGVEE